MPRPIERETEVLCQPFESLQVVARRRDFPRFDCAVLQGQFRVRNDEVGIEELDDAEAAASIAPSGRTVEREQPGLDLVDGETGHRAGEAGRKGHAFRGIGILGDQQAVGQSKGRLGTVGKAGLETLADHDPVYHHLDVVVAMAIERRRVVGLVQDPVDLDPLEALPQEIFQVLPELALAVADHGTEEEETGSGRLRHHGVNHLGDRLAADGQAGGGGIGHADPGEQQPEIVLDLSDGADGRARIV